MSSFNILYNGQKKTIKASPNVLMQAVLTEAAEKFGLDPNKCTLHHKKVAIDKSQSIRFCGIPNLAQIELRFNDSVTTNMAATSNCRIALSVANENSCTGSFPSDTTISEMLLLFVEQGGLKSEYLLSPHEVIYLRTAVTGDALKSTTLGNLGLAGQGGRLQFRQLAGSSVVSPEIIAGNNAMSSSTDTASSNSIVDMEVCNPADFTRNVESTISPLMGASVDEVIPHFPAQIMAHVTAIAKQSITAIADTRSDEKIGSYRDPSVSNDKKVINSERQSSATSFHVPDKQSEKKSRSEAILNKSECLDVLLSENFDRVSTPCVLTIVKYIQNIISDPADPKYRTINTGNKTFQDKVLQANSALNLMRSIGFKEVPGSPALCTSATVDELSASLILLEGAMDRLLIPVSDRPKAKQPAIPASQSQVALPEWDPYQSSIVRTAPQPSRGGKSVTEVALERLQVRRRELEGTPDSVERRTEVLMPLSDGSVASIQDFLDGGKVVAAEEEEVESGPSDSTLIARSLASKMRGGKGAEEEEEPMTTAAVRELRRLQKERVYTHALIRVHFPDRVCVQGYFHVRHSLRDVYEWVYSILNLDNVKMDEKKRGKAGKEDGEDYFQVFELYTSPPRCSLHPYSKSGNENEGPSSSSSGAASSADKANYLTLIEAHLVPAALIYLSWGPAHPGFVDRNSKASVSSSSHSSGSCSAVAEEQPSLGRYLSLSLLSTASSKLGSQQSTAATSYPTGESLVAPSGPGPSNAKSSASDTVTSTADSKQDGSERVTGSKESKPKWLKIGKQ